MRSFIDRFNYQRRLSSDRAREVGIMHRRLAARLATLLTDADTLRLLACMLLSQEQKREVTESELPGFLLAVPDEQKLVEQAVSGRHAELKSILKKTTEAIPLDVAPVERLYREWEGLVSLLGEKPKKICQEFSRTKYYQSKMVRLGRLKGKVKVAEYYALFRSLGREGFMADESRPVIIIEGFSETVLIDGAHRSVAMKHMGYKEVQGYRYSASELLGVREFSEAERWALQKI